MPDTPRPVATDRDQDRHRYTLTLRDVQHRFDAATLPRTIRTLQRYCESGRLDCLRDETPGSVLLVDPASVERAIGELILIHGDRHDATGRDMTVPVALDDKVIVEPDLSRQVATGRDNATEKINKEGQRQIPTQTDVSRHDATPFDIFQHPYVLKLEERNEKLEAKYEAQVRRTEEVQLIAHEKLLELQRMTTIGQSRTLADFMLQAKNMIFGGTSGDPNSVGETSAKAERPQAGMAL